MDESKEDRKTSCENGLSGSHPSISGGQQGEVDLVDFGETHFRRSFNTMSIIAMSFNICNSWVGIASSIAIAIAAGGVVSLIYGILVVAAAMLCLALSLAELAAVCPTAGGQYHFVSLFAPARCKKSASYISGFLGIASWISISSAISLVASNTLVSIIIRYRDSFAPQKWHVFLIYQSMNLQSVVYSVFLSKRSNYLYDFGFCLSISLLIVLTIICPAMSSTHATNNEVWGTFVNSSGGWSDGVSFIIGLTTSQFMMLGLDGSLHMAEECLEPARVIPKALIMTVLTGSGTSFVFAVAMAYCITDVSTILSTSTGLPIYALWELSTGSHVAATIFTVAYLLICLVALNACNQTSSRLTWSFAHDNALIFSRIFNKTSPTLHVPVYALFFNGVAVAFCGIVFLVSTTAFNSFINTAEITNLCSLALPSVFVLWRKRPQDLLSPNSSFHLPGWLSYFVHAATVIYVSVVTVFFCFPPALPVTSSNMNYCSAVVGIILVLGLLNWVLHGRKHYRVPDAQASP